MKRLSSSEIRMYQRCRRAWYFRYHLGYEPRRDPTEGGAMRVGTLVHLGLEAHYTGGSPTEVLEAEVAPRVAEIEEQGGDPKKVKADLDLSRIMVEGYIDWLEETGADAGLSVVGVEEEISAPLLPGVEIIGKVDWLAVDENTGHRVILDNKTCMTAEDQEVAAPLNPQFKQYALIDRLNQEDKAEEGISAVEVRWLRRVKRTARATPPFYGRVFVDLATPVLRAYLRQTRVHATEIMSASERLATPVDAQEICAPTPHRDCGFCSFRAVCPLVDSDPDAVEDVLSWSYDKVDPLARYAGAKEETDA